MITSLVNQTRELTDAIRCPGMESPGRITTSLKILSKRKSPVEPRWVGRATYKKLQPQPAKMNSFKSWPSKKTYKQIIHILGYDVFASVHILLLISMDNAIPDSFCFMSWCLKCFCAVGVLCMFSYFLLS